MVAKDVSLQVTIGVCTESTLMAENFVSGLRGAKNGMALGFNGTGVKALLGVGECGGGCKLSSDVVASGVEISLIRSQLQWTPACCSCGTVAKQE